jgi:hypothetical protein
MSNSILTVEDIKALPIGHLETHGKWCLQVAITNNTRTYWFTGSTFKRRGTSRVTDESAKAIDWYLKLSAGVPGCRL